MPIDLANYEKQLKRFGKKFEQFAGKKTSSVLTGSATATASSTTTSSVGDLTRALEHSSRVLSQCEKEPPPPPIQYQSTSPFDVPSFRETASSFDVPTTSSLSSSSFSPASSRQTPIRRSTSTSISTSTSTSIRSSVRWQERVDGRERVPQRAARLATAWLGLTQHHPSHIRCSCATSCASVTRTIGLVSCRMHLSKWQETRGQNALLGGLWGVNSGVYLGPSRKRRGAQIGWVPDVNSQSLNGRQACSCSCSTNMFANIT